MNTSYQQYLKLEIPTEESGFSNYFERITQMMSSCCYAYNKIIQLCKNSLSERKEQGQKHFIKALGVIIGAYHILGKRKNTSMVHSLEKRVRIWELRNFVKGKFIKHLLIQVVKLMPGKVESLIGNRKLLGGLEITIYNETLQFLTGDKKFLSDSETTYEKDLVIGKQSIINKSVS